MAEDETSWSEKGKGTGRGKRPPKSGAEASGKGTTPTRPSKRAERSGADSASGQSEVVRTPSSDAGARKVARAAATAGQRDVSFLTRLGFPALIMAICLVGIGVVAYARSTRDALASPVQNVDHWHAVYGVYNCNYTGEGDAKYLPPFQSTQDLTGIHSHGDGLMHIHPFFELSSGSNAQTRHWFSEMNVEISTERISVNNEYDPPVELVAGEECADGTGTAEIKVLRWDWDFEALGDRRTDPEVITADLGEIRFQHDREVYVFAYVGEDTDLSEIPRPPQVRFDTLNNVSASIDYTPDTLVPQDTGVEVDTDASDDTDAGNETEEADS